MAIKLIVGLGNPGKDYQSHRHNVGFWFVDTLSNLFGFGFKEQSKFFGEFGKANIAGQSIYVLKPNVYMNRSGQSIDSLAKFYKIPPEQILVVHDELDLPCGTAKLKFSGGHGGHNGLRDTIKALNTQDFYRLRIGIDHPGDKSLVSDYVLNAPKKNELGFIQDALTDALQVIDDIVLGNHEKAMQQLHTVK